MMKRWGVIALVVIVILGLCALVTAVGGVKLITGLFNNSRELGDSANAFMTALRDEKLDDAYAMLVTELQQQQSKAAFREDFTGNSIKDWKFTHFSSNNDVGYVQGTLIDNDGNHYVAFQLFSQNRKWKISGYNLGIVGWVGTVSDPVN